MVVKSKRDPIYPLRNPSSCTRCPYNQTGSPCFKCPGNTQLSNSGKCWLSLDALPTGDMTRQGISARIKQAVIKHPFLASLAAAYTKGPKTHSFRHLARAYAREAL